MKCLEEMGEAIVRENKENKKIAYGNLHTKMSKHFFLLVHLYEFSSRLIQSDHEKKQDQPELKYGWETSLLWMSRITR